MFPRAKTAAINLDEVTEVLAPRDGRRADARLAFAFAFASGARFEKGILVERPDEPADESGGGQQGA